MSYGNGPKIVTSGLQLCLDFANPHCYDGTQTSSVYDLGPNKLVCSFSNLSGSAFPNNFYFTSSKGGSMIFNTGSQGLGAINTGKSFSTLGLFTSSTGYTLETWCSLNGYATNAQAQGAVVLGGPGHNQGIIVLSGKFNFYTWYYNTSASFINLSTSYNLSAPVTASLWYHVVGVYQVGPPMLNLLYVNGVLAGSGSYSNFSSMGDVNCIVGGTNFMLTYYQYSAWDGSVGVARVYNKALSLAEVQRNFCAQRGRFGI